MSVWVRSWPFSAAVRASGCDEREGGARKSVRRKGVELDDVETMVCGAKSGVSSIVTKGGMVVVIDEISGMSENDFMRFPGRGMWLVMIVFVAHVD
jgi:hypothetical protein